ncbi:DEAD/DEAH box helicase family protein [Allohahella sp. A8]|uniref:DEAD/DEAH box helicase family protein n=1 Tax=Allohahella sp. A8 TaxID=3141461 RepID=UPI003A801588
MKSEPKPDEYTGQLITGGPTDHILPWLCNAINRAVRVDMAVAFIQRAGLELLRDDLQSVLTRDNVQVRILTSDYFGITDPQALRELMLLQQSGAEVKVYECAPGTSFHLKTYLFVHQLGQGGSNVGLVGEAFIGSSNISRQALKDGLEWNYRICYPGDDGFLATQHQFNQLFAHPRAVSLTHRRIDEYELRRRPPATSVAPGSHEIVQPPTPTSVQVEALAALDESRLHGYRRGLVVLATGLGKTWLAAFDVKASQAKRVLFVAHREEILHQAAATFVCIGEGLRVGFYKGQQRDVDVDVLCASIQTIGRSAHLEQFATTHFDYIVVDEFHHAAAPS